MSSAKKDSLVLLNNIENYISDAYFDKIDFVNISKNGIKEVFIGTGVWRSNTLHIQGENLVYVHFAINYLTNPDVYMFGHSLNVIGAEKSAMNVARTEIRHGCCKVMMFMCSECIVESVLRLNM